MPKIGKTTEDAIEKEEKRGVKEEVVKKAPALRGTKGKRKEEEKDYQATPEDVDVAMGAADNEVSWDALSIPVDVDEGKHVYRGSMIGGCVTSLVALQLKDALGLAVSEGLPANVQAAAQAGTDNEAAIIAKFCAEFGYRRATYPELEQLKEDGRIAGYNPEMDQVQVRREVGKRAVLRSHPDAILTHVTGDARAFFDLEVKFLGPDLFKAFKKSGLEAKGDVWEKYGWQMSARIASHGLPLIFVGAEKLGGNVDSEIGELVPLVFQVDEAVIPWSDIKEKIKECEKYVKEGVLPDECGKGTFGCPAFKLPQCGSGEEKRIEERVEDEELGSLLARQFAYNTDKREAEKLLKVINPAIRKIMEARYPTAGDYTYTVKDAAGNEFKWEWQEFERKGYVVEDSVVSYSKVQLVGKAEEASDEEA